MLAVLPAIMGRKQREEPSPCTSGKAEGKVADPKDGVSRGVEGCTEAEEVEVGRIDRMEMFLLWPPPCRCCGLLCVKFTRTHARY
jgi:hypothetical protein